MGKGGNGRATFRTGGATEKDKKSNRHGRGFGPSAGTDRGGPGGRARHKEGRNDTAMRQRRSTAIRGAVQCR